MSQSSSSSWTEWTAKTKFRVELVPNKGWRLVLVRELEVLAEVAGPVETVRELEELVFKMVDEAFEDYR